MAGIKELATELAGVYGEDADKDGTALKLGERMAELFPSRIFLKRELRKWTESFSCFLRPTKRRPTTNERTDAAAHKAPQRFFCG